MLTLYTEVDTKSAFSFLSVPTSIFLSIFFFNDTATTEIYTLSLHDALPICGAGPGCYNRPLLQRHYPHSVLGAGPKTHSDRKSTRLNSSHSQISYAVFCLKKKKNNPNSITTPRTSLRQTVLIRATIP